MVTKKDSVNKYKQSGIHSIINKYKKKNLSNTPDFIISHSKTLHKKIENTTHNNLLYQQKRS